MFVVFFVYDLVFFEYFDFLEKKVGTIFANEDNKNSSNGIVNNGITSKKFHTFHIVNLVLLALYEAVSLNRNFISLLTTVSYY